MPEIIFRLLLGVYVLSIPIENNNAFKGEKSIDAEYLALIIESLKNLLPTPAHIYLSINVNP
jgi:hypothetical protein